MTRPEIQVLDLHFKPLIDRVDINRRVAELGHQLTKKYSGLEPIFIGVLKGSFVFLSDLVRACGFPLEIEFVQCSSYQGLERSNQMEITSHFDLKKLKDRHVVIVEDIVDSGETVKFLSNYLSDRACATISIVTLLLKPEVYKGPVKPEYIGFEIPNEFVVGYGLDYNGFGREWADIFVLDQKLEV